ncbi:MAG: hypothetical protein QOF13_1512 [Solirubrobacterales bacterium]|jgi:hypothetical protein|nr:hypothetical protein [Solirubrobacterales bacterium]
MRKAFKASRLMGLCAIVFGLMAFGATAAQAEPGAYWLVNGTDIGKTLLPEVNAKSDSAVTTLLTKVGVTNVEILCPTIKLVGAKLHELGRATGKIHYEGCKTSLNGGAHVKNCEPKSHGAAAGLIETNALDALLKLHILASGAKDELLELLPEAGTVLVPILLGALCAIGDKFNISGKVTIKDCLGEGLVDKKEHLFEEGPLSALLFGSNPAVIDGSAFGFLIGAHAGMKFAGHA